MQEEVSMDRRIARPSGASRLAVADRSVSATGPASTSVPDLGRDRDLELDLDRIRATLMVLGVVLHAADVFLTTGDWLVADRHRSVVFDALVALIHSFRVPGFFLLSGLLFAGSLGRHGAPELLARQLLRLGLPLLTCWTLLNSVQLGLMAWHRGADPWEAFFSLNTPMYHLWFLRNLLVLDVLVLAGAMLLGARRTGRAAGPLQRLVQRLTQRLNQRFTHRLDGLGLHGPAQWLGVALAGALLNQALLIAVRLTGIAYDLGPGGLTLFSLFFHAPMFLAGLVMWHRPAWLRAWLRTPLWLLPVAAFLADWGDGASSTLSGPVAREAALTVQLLGLWIATGAAVGALGRLRRGARSPFGRLLSDASYTIFLVHHLAVVALALALLPMDWPASVKFGLIVSGALAFSLAVHLWVVRPSGLMRLLLNGRAPVADPRGISSYRGPAGA